MSFDPNAPAGENSGIYGLPFEPEDAAIVLLPVPWEATTSYGGGTSEGPRAILEASRQVDLYDLDVEKPYEAGIAMLPIRSDVKAWSDAAKLRAEEIIAHAGATGDDPKLLDALAFVNRESERVNAWVRNETEVWLAAGKIVGVVGGDHSAPLGAIQAVAARTPELGILHLDAHSDTRKAYEGFTFSHASIHYNVLESVPNVSRLVQVGIRDMCEEEMTYVRSQGERVAMYSDRDVGRAKLEGKSFAAIAREAIQKLPDDVWISFDIDGLDPRFCPNTGTPVPGGLDFHEATMLFRELVRANKRVVGFDLTEVAPAMDDSGDEWDANVGARVLYKLCAFTLASQGKARLFD